MISNCPTCGKRRVINAEFGECNDCHELRDKLRGAKPLLTSGTHGLVGRSIPARPVSDKLDPWEA